MSEPQAIAGTQPFALKRISAILPSSQVRRKFENVAASRVLDSHVSVGICEFACVAWMFEVIE